MGMGLPDDRRKADSSYCAKAQEAWSWWEPLIDPPLSNLLDGNLRLKALEGALSNFWQDLSAVFADISFTRTVLLVVCFTCILALVFEAPIEIILPTLALGCLTALAEYAMRDHTGRN
jgi:hypothetical protein